RHLPEPQRGQAEGYDHGGGVLALAREGAQDLERRVVVPRAVQEERRLEAHDGRHLRAGDVQGAGAVQRGERRVVIAQPRRGEPEEAPGLPATLPGGGEPLQVVPRLWVSL